MEADWAVEIGPEMPVIDADWSGFVNLRNTIDGVNSVAEAVAAPALREVLLALNSSHSPVFTSKCDVWELTEAEIDPDEFGCRREEAHAGWASWIDVVARGPERFVSFAEHEAWVQGVIWRLQAEPISHGRADIVVRSAILDANEGFGITLYAAGCGVDTQVARAAWTEVLRATVAATMGEAAPRASSSIG